MPELDSIRFTPSGAELSDDGIYRYDLWRIWDHDAPELLVLGINPSKADANRTDPTLTRVIGFGRSLGCGGVRMMNVSPLRATDPRVLARAVLDHRDAGGIDPFPRRGITAIHGAVPRARYVVAAFGDFAFATGDARRILQGHADAMCDSVRQLGADVYALGTTKHGWPRHPLYLRADAQPSPWRWPRDAR